MGLFSKKKERAFHLTKHKGSFTLENQDGKIDEINQYDILSYLEIVFNDESQFITLVPPFPIKKVQFIQAVKYGQNEVEVQIAIEKEGKSYLYYKIYSEEECKDLFIDFFVNHDIPNMEEYKPVEFL